MSLSSEFERSAVKGDVVDPAVGVVTGGASGTTVDSMVGRIDRLTKEVAPTAPGASPQDIALLRQICRSLWKWCAP